VGRGFFVLVAKSTGVKVGEFVESHGSSVWLDTDVIGKMMIGPVGTKQGGLN